MKEFLQLICVISQRGVNIKNSSRRTGVEGAGLVVRHFTSQVVFFGSQ